MGYSPWGHKESNIYFPFTQSTRPPESSCGGWCISVAVGMEGETEE